MPHHCQGRPPEPGTTSSQAMQAQFLLLLNLPLHTHTHLEQRKGAPICLQACRSHREPETETALWQITLLSRFLLYTEGRGIFQDYLWAGFLRAPEAFSRRSPRPQLTGEFISPHLFMFHVKYLKSNPNLTRGPSQDTDFGIHESTCEHVTHNATQRQRLKKVILQLALPNECVYKKPSDQTVTMIKKDHLTCQQKKAVIKETPRFLPLVSLSIVKICLCWSLNIFLISNYCLEASLWRRVFFPSHLQQYPMSKSEGFFKKPRLNTRFSLYVQSRTKCLPFLNDSKILMTQVCCWNGDISSSFRKDFSLLAVLHQSVPRTNKLPLKCL